MVEARGKRIITVYVSEWHLQMIQKLVDLGIVASRSEAVRQLMDKSLNIWIKERMEIEESMESISHYNHNHTDSVRVPTNDIATEFRQYKIVKRMDYNE